MQSVAARRVVSLAPRVLWIDDEVELIRPLVQHLKDEGCYVDVVPDGTTGLQRVAAAAFDLILLDYRLRNETGFDVLEHLRRIPNCPPVVLLSAYATLELGVDAIRRGAVEVKTKPIDAARRMLVDAVFDRSCLDDDVAQVIARFEVGDADAVRRRMRDIGREFNLNPDDLGRRVRDQTRPRFARWRLCARLRQALSEVGAGSEPIKTIGFNAGWTWSEDFSRDFRKVTGTTAEQFRALMHGTALTRRKARSRSAGFPSG